MIHFRVYRPAWASPSPRHSSIEFRLKPVIAFLTRPFLCGMSAAPAVSLSIQVVQSGGRDGGDDGARGRARGGGARRGRGSGRGRFGQPFRLASGLCVTGGKLHNKTLPVVTHTFGHGDMAETYVRIDLTQRWLQEAVTGKAQNKLAVFCPVLNEIRWCYIAAVEGDEDDKRADADNAAVNEQDDPMNRMALACISNRAVDASTTNKETVRKRKWQRKKRAC